MVTDPEAHLRAMGAEARRSLQVLEPPPSALTSTSQLQAVGNAFVMLGLLPEPVVESALAEHRAALERVGVAPQGELTIRPGAHGFWDARRRGRDELKEVTMAVAAPRLEIHLRAAVVQLDWLVLTPSGLRGVALIHRNEDDTPATAHWRRSLSELSVTDSARRSYRLVATAGTGNRETWSGGVATEPPLPSDTDWIEIAALGACPPQRVVFEPVTAVPVGRADPPWPTPAECYLAWLAPEVSPADTDATFGIGLDAHQASQVVAAVADALLAVGALPPQSPLLRHPPARDQAPWRSDVANRWAGRVHRRAAQPGSHTSYAGLTAALPLERAVAILEWVGVDADAVTLGLYIFPYVTGEYWPVSVPCMQVAAADDEGGRYETMPATFGSGGGEKGEGHGDLLVWPPVASHITRLRITVSTMWEAAWADIDLPGR
jgi:hypothetical protein